MVIKVCNVFFYDAEAEKLANIIRNLQPPQSPPPDATPNPPIDYSMSIDLEEFSTNFSEEEKKIILALELNQRHPNYIRKKRKKEK